MRRKALFFDIDGTLWDEDSVIPDSACRAIAAMKAAGHAVLICTGRSRGYVYDRTLLSLGFDGIVSSAGAMLEIGSRTLYCLMADRGALRRAIASARALGYGPLLEGNEALYLDRADMPDTPYIDKLFHDLGSRLRPLGGADGTWPDVTKLSLIARGRPDPEGMTARLRADWDVTVHAPEVLELTPHGIDKGTGLLRALDALGIGRADSVAFGDSANDLAMFREAGMGIAMGNASGPLREKAHYVTTDLHDDGIWNAWQYLEAHP